MHASSQENMRLCYRRYIQGGPFESADKVTVLDFGGADVNGGYKEIFQGPQFDYIAADLAAGDGVTIVLENPYELPFEEGSIDIVISGQTFEHCEFFWLAFAEMARVLKHDGYMFLIAPSAGPIHQYPVDCYRFYPDAYHALAKYAKCDLIEVWRDERGPWRDLVGVFRRRGAPSAPPRAYPAPARIDNARRDYRGAPEEETIRGTRAYRDILAQLHEALEPSCYLEIGVRHGHSLALANCPAIGVDPKPELAVALPSAAQIVVSTSDDFFAGPHEQMLTRRPDLVFIDGMHLFEFALRDFMHVERAASPCALVVIDDIFPNHPAQAARERRTNAWTGDVWKLHDCLRTHRPDLFLLALDAAPAGLLLIAGLDRNNRVLWDEYNPIARAYASNRDDPPPQVLSRAGACTGASSILAPLGATLRDARFSGVAGARLVERLRALAVLDDRPSPKPGSET
jgi:predicted O-methyltransferase YrrM